MGLGHVNCAPRRWVDPTARVRVVEGWHPSRPDAVGYNLLIDDTWVGTYESLEKAAEAAMESDQMGPLHPSERTISLLPRLEP